MNVFYCVTLCVFTIVSARYCKSAFYKRKIVRWGGDGPGYKEIDAYRALMFR